MYIMGIYRIQIRKYRWNEKNKIKKNPKSLNAEKQLTFVIYAFEFSSMHSVMVRMIVSPKIHMLNWILTPKGNDNKR